VSIRGHSLLRAGRASFGCIWPVVLALGATVASVPAAADEAPDAAVRASVPRSDARSGDLIVYEPRPVLARELRACSFRHPLCVHTSPLSGPRAGGEALALLDAADQAWDVATGALSLPPPDTEAATTGTLDLYLVPGDPYATRTRLDMRDPRTGFDAAGAFALVGQGVSPGCALDEAAARVVARAILYGVAPATDEGSALAESAYMARLMVPCASRPSASLTLFQAHPELGLADTLAPPGEVILPDPGPRALLKMTPAETYATGASLFYDWVDDSFGGYPGAIVRTMWALSPTLTSSGATRWNNEPDGFEVLRTSFKNALTTGSTVDDLWLDFAVARAFVPSYPVRLEWSVEWPYAPRTLMSGTGIAPTGAAYIAVDCLKMPKGARLRFEARWEEHARMLWALVRVGADGREISRVGVPGPDRGTEAQTTLVDLDGVARVLIVGSSAGDPLIPFDPDDRVWEPHGWIVSLAAD
jgi:hypothetical protein